MPACSEGNRRSSYKYGQGGAGPSNGAGVHEAKAPVPRTPAYYNQAGPGQGAGHRGQGSDKVVGGWPGGPQAHPMPEGHRVRFEAGTSLARGGVIVQGPSGTRQPFSIETA